LVLDFSQKKGSDVSAFLEYFDKKKDSLSIISPQGQNAVQIMTIHKSKGLEFPVVVFPYADLDIYRELEPKEWFSVDKDKYNGFSHTLLNYNKDFEHFGDEGLRIFNTHQSEQELDNINLLYVSLTRAAEQLHIISTKDVSSKGVVNNKKYSGLLISYLQHLGIWNDAQETYNFGTPKATETKTDAKQDSSKKDMQLQQSFISTAKEDHNIRVVTKSGLLWDTSQQEAIEKGNLTHHIMAQIKTIDNIDAVLENVIKSSAVNQEQAVFLKETVTNIVEHPELKHYFTSNYTIYNERDIISKDGIILRPDRLVINTKNEAVIIDYKTGFIDQKHAQQLQTYQDALEAMDLVVLKKVLIYINDAILVKEI